MSREKVLVWVNDFLLIFGFGSWIYNMFSAISEWCKLFLPITGVLSFIIYVLINWAKIKEFFKA